MFQDDMAVTSKLSLSQAVDPTLSQLEAQERSSLESRGQRSVCSGEEIKWGMPPFTRMQPCCHKWQDFFPLFYGQITFSLSIIC